MGPDRFGHGLLSSLTFRSSDATVIELGFNISHTLVDREDLDLTRDQMGWEVFTQAIETIGEHPSLS